MDVVKKKVEELHGRIEIQSQVGAGSTFTLYIPLTLSILEGMLIRVGETILTIPLLNIRETLVAKDRVITKDVNGLEYIKIRDHMLPIIKLSEFLGVRANSSSLDQGLLVVVESGSKLCCLHLDEILGQRQTVIKRASKFFGDIKGISGFTILSNGEIALILDVTRFESYFTQIE